MLPTTLPAIGGWLLVLSVVVIVWGSESTAYKMGIAGGFCLGGAVAGSVGKWISDSGSDLADMSGSFTDRLVGTSITGVPVLVIWMVLRKRMQAGGGAAGSRSRVGARAGARAGAVARGASAAAATTAKGGRGGKVIGRAWGFLLLGGAWVVGWALGGVPWVWPAVNAVVNVLVEVGTRLGGTVGGMF